MPTPPTDRARRPATIRSHAATFPWSSRGRGGLFATVALLCAGGLVGCGTDATPGAGSGGRSGGSGGAGTGGAVAPGSGGRTMGGTGGASTGGTVGTGGTGTGGAPAGSGGSNNQGGRVGSGGVGQGAGGANQGGRSGQAGSASTGGGGANQGGRGGQAGSVGSGGAGGASAAGRDLWVSPTGSDTAAGTQAAPLKTLQRAALMAAPGTTIWMMPGTHAYDARIVIQSDAVNTSLSSDGTVNPPAPGRVQNGTADRPIRIWAAPGARPVLDFSSQKAKAGTNTSLVSGARGILMWAHYWHLRGLEIKEAADNCIHVAGSHNTFEDLQIHDCGDTGLQITVPEALQADKTLGAYNRILNCDSYRNYDEATGGENADGFAAKDRVGPGNEFRGCRAWENTDDGWDFFQNNEPVVLENCWAFNMRHPMATDSSDGNGFKLGGQRDDAPTNKADHRLTRCFAFSNPAVGFDLNNNTGNITCSMCGAWANKTNWESGITHTGDVTLTVTPEQARAVQRGTDGALPDITTVR